MGANPNRRKVEWPASLDALCRFLIATHDQETALFLINLLLTGYNRGAFDARFEDFMKESIQ